MRTAVDIATAIISLTVVALLKVVWDLNNRIRNLEGHLEGLLWRKAQNKSNADSERQ